MSGFLYYFPGARQVDRPTPARLAEWGMSLLFDADNPPVSREVVANGPDGSSGIVLADPRTCQPHECEMNAGGQLWEKSVAGAWWVGRRKDDPLPGPNELGRSKTLPGHWVKMLDGNDWLIPTAIGCAESNGDMRAEIRVPTGLSYSDGHWKRGEVVPTYRRLWEIAAHHLSAVERAQLEGQTARLTLDDLCGQAAEVLSANYRVGPHEISALGLFDDDTAFSVLNACIDLPTWLNSLKKKADRDGVNTLHGVVG